MHESCVPMIDEEQIDKTIPFWRKELTPYRVLKICSLLIAAIFLFMSWGHGFFWLNAAVWAAIIVFFFSVKLPIIVSLVIVTAGIVVSLYISLSAQNNMVWGDYLNRVKAAQTAIMTERDEQNEDNTPTLEPSLTITPEN